MNHAMNDVSRGAVPVSARPGSPGPLLSLIIPVYNLQDYIEACLAAISDQAFKDVEIIVVDGGSDDETPERLAKCRLDEPRLTVVREGRIGPGRARNVGARLAAGDYIWFIDGDDLIAPSSLPAISERLRETRPDVLLVNHDIVRANGVHEASQDNAILSRELPDSFTLAERPWLIDIRIVSWNKIIRRDFLAHSGAEFLSAFPHEDVPVSCHLLMVARRLSVLPEVCYSHAERAGSITNSGDQRRHFRIFAAWETILRRARQDTRPDDGPVTSEVYRALFQRAIWHCSNVLDAVGPSRSRPDAFVARAHRKEFFTLISDLYRSYVPEDYQPPPGLRGVKFRLFANNWYPAYEALDPLNQARMAVLRRRGPIYG
jgi:CDP-glycerol glycerophosphotransferase